MREIDNGFQVNAREWSEDDVATPNNNDLPEKIAGRQIRGRIEDSCEKR
jgi:hypothetical protein